MSTTIIYLLKLSVSLGVVFLFYQLVLRRLTFYNWNRWYLLGYSLLSFVIPFIDITPALHQNELNNAALLQWVPILYNQSGAAPFLTTWNVLSLIIVAGMLVVLIRLLIQLISFRRMMRKATLLSDDAVNLYQVNESIIPFSFGNGIFINRHLHTEKELEEIIRHEFVHVKQHHSIDIIFSEIICMLNWYNPFAWMLKAAIRQNLEFIADNQLLENGIDKKQYQYMLLKVIGDNHFSIAQKFNFSSLKKRIAMMNKRKSAKMHLLRFLFILPVLALILVSFRKEIAENLTGKQKQLQQLPVAIIDTVPEVTKPNSKGYIINVKDKKGECLLVIKDKTGKEVKRLMLTEWNADAEKFEATYGEIPPPPPPSGKLPEDVRRISINDNEAKVVFKDGKEVSYNLNDPKQKEAFENKYGGIEPIPAVPSVPPVPPIKKYTGIVYKNGEDIISKFSDDFEITDKKAIINLKNGKREEYNLTNIDQRNKFENKYGRIVSVSPVQGSVDIIQATPVSIVSGAQTVNVISPRIVRPVQSAYGANEVMVINDEGNVITGDEDLIITITKNTTKEELEEFKKTMKAKDVDLSFDNLEFNNKGILVSISGKMIAKDVHGNFSATDFKKLILAMVKKGSRTYFKVHVSDNRVVI